MNGFRKLGDHDEVRALAQWMDEHQWQIWARGAFGAYRGCRLLGMDRKASVQWVWRARPL